jgi:hypothetical protein
LGDWVGLATLSIRAGDVAFEFNFRIRIVGTVDLSIVARQLAAGTVCKEKVNLAALLLRERIKKGAA